MNIISTVFSKIELRLISALMIFLLSSMNTSGQNLIEAFGGIKTDYVIMSGIDTMDVIDQLIVERGVRHSATDYLEYGYGYGLQMWHLEFMTNSEMDVITPDFGARYRYLMEFYDGEGDMIMKTYLNRDVLRQDGGSRSFKIYTIRLNGIPLLTLDKARLIIIRILKE